jgi:hypothetical protein
MKSVLFALGLFAATAQAGVKQGLKGLIQEKYCDDPFANEPLFYDDFAEASAANSSAVDVGF